MKNKVLLVVAILFLIACNQGKQLNYIEFKVSKDTLIDSLKTATILLDKMDEMGFGSGSACFVNKGRFHYSHSEKGFAIVDMPLENSLEVPIIEPFDQANSVRLFNLVNFLNKNGINGMVKRWDGLCFFGYKQDEFNPYNDYERRRDIVYLKEPTDIYNNYFKGVVIHERYKNIVLIALEPKKPMDSASEKKTTDHVLKQREHRRKDKLIGVWGSSINENASFKIQHDSIYYPEHFKSYPYITRKDSIFILFDGWTYRCKYAFINDSLVLKDKDKVAMFVRF